jgi:hypothetical protein
VQLYNVINGINDEIGGWNLYKEDQDRKKPLLSGRPMVKLFIKNLSIEHPAAMKEFLQMVKHTTAQDTSLHC